MSYSLVLQGVIVAITGNFGLLRWCFLHVKFLIRGGAASAIITRVMFHNSSGNGMNQMLRDIILAEALAFGFKLDGRVLSLAPLL